VAIRILSILILLIFSAACKGLSSGTTGTPSDNIPTPLNENVAPKLVRDDVLVVINNNSPASIEVGEYYALKRNIPAENIARVDIRANYWIRDFEMLNLRDQLIKYLLENTLATPYVPVVCANAERYYCEENLIQIRESSRIKYIAVTKGVPTRTLYAPVCTGGFPNVNDYLRFWLTNYYAPGGEPCAYFAETNVRKLAFKNGRGMRLTKLSEDREFMVSRIDGITTQAAKDLIDRTIEVEKNGLYGNLYSSSFGRYGTHINWVNPLLDDYGQEIGHTYPKSGAPPWHYFNQIMNESHDECYDYMNFHFNDPLSKAPANCKAYFQDGNSGEASYGQKINSTARTQPVINAFASFQQLQGHNSGSGYFDNLTVWKKNSACTVLFCKDHADPAACRANSRDALKEINTDCMGVADGFIGYNFQSFPVSYFSAWPSAWAPGTAYSWELVEGGDYGEMTLPIVRDDEGSDDNYSLWFGEPDRIASQKCFASNDFSLAKTDCVADLHDMLITTQVITPPEVFSDISGETYHIKFKIKTEGAFNYYGPAFTLPLVVTMGVHQRATLQSPAKPATCYGAANSENNYKLECQIDPNVDFQATVPLIAYPAVTPIADLTGTAGWTEVSVDIPINPALHASCVAPCYVDGFKIQIKVLDFNGKIGIDDFRFTKGADATNYAHNGSFNKGHFAVGAGDHAAMFTSRLGGVAFWGSTSHFATGGFSFSSRTGPSFIYFMRGLPISDAVFLGEDRPSGLLYADPIYSPVSVKLDYLIDDPWERETRGFVQFVGSTVNGRDPTKVSTEYEIDYCENNDDIRACDQGDLWQATGLDGKGGKDRHYLGKFSFSGKPTGDYLFRLRVTSTNATLGKTQTFNDYRLIRNWSGCKAADLIAGPPTALWTLDTDLDTKIDLCDKDDDNDGVSDVLDGRPLDPTETLDSDHDTIGNNADLDDDNDGLPDVTEIANGLNPIVSDALSDKDLDGVNNITEYIRGTAINNNASYPTLNTFYVDKNSASLTEDGSLANPYKTIAAAVAVALYGDTINIATEYYNEFFQISNKAITVVGNNSRVNVLNINGATSANIGTKVSQLITKNIVVNNAQQVILEDIEAGSVAPIGSKAFYATNGSTVKINHGLIVGIQYGLDYDLYSIVDINRTTVRGTIAGYTCSDYCGGNIHNSILNANSYPYILSVNGEGEVSYTNIGLYGGLGGYFLNISNYLEVDPLFVNPTVVPRDFNLQPTSPCIGAGDPVNGSPNMGYY
jgi:uncharacterized protein (TIGR03790 family)